MAKPAPRSTRVKQPDFITKTLSSASGDSRPSGCHQLFWGSWTASAPSLWVQLGISDCLWGLFSSHDAAETGAGTKDADMDRRETDVATATERAKRIKHPSIWFKRCGSR